MKKKFLFFLASFLAVLGVGGQANISQAASNDEVTYSYVSHDPVGVSFAIDVSGSMKNTDPSGLTYEMINLFSHSLSSQDYISVVAYNDTIVYDSGLISVGDKNAVLALMEQLEQVSYGGDTDNGMGLLTATNHLVESEIDFSEEYVFLISDGDTDIPISSERTKEDSDKDLYECAKLASENNIVLHAVEYTDSILQDTNTLSIITSSTGGSTQIVSDRSNYLLVMMNLFYSSYHHGKTDFEIEKADNKVFRKEFVYDDIEEYEYQSIVISTETLADLQVFKNDGTQISSELVSEENSRGIRYFYVKSDEMNTSQATALYSISEDAVVVSGTVRTEKKKVQDPTVIIQETTVVITETPKEPDPVPIKKTDWSYIFKVGLIVLIILVTILICVAIIKRLLFQKKQLPAITGVLVLRFIDLKSVHESADYRWNLAEYPGEGVTLKELFESASIKDDFTDLNKVCFYPGNKLNELTFVHCMEGGVFKGEQLIKRNTSVAIRPGDILFFSFSENSSEISITYETV